MLIAICMVPMDPHGFLDVSDRLSRGMAVPPDASVASTPQEHAQPFHPHHRVGVPHWLWALLATRVAVGARVAGAVAGGKP